MKKAPNASNGLDGSINKFDQCQHQSPPSLFSTVPLQFDPNTKRNERKRALAQIELHISMSPKFKLLRYPKIENDLFNS